MIPRLYLDTSVYGGCFDEEFAKESLMLFEAIKQGIFRLVISDATLFELQSAPEQVRRVLDDLPKDTIEVIEPSEDIIALRDAYIESGVIGQASTSDAEHIAAASIARVDLLVSWNFKHIVNIRRIRGYQAINLLQGYYPIAIFSPKEVVHE